MSPTIHPVILSGGSGSRLWPLSRSRKPKQFLSIFGDTSLFCQTLNRLDANNGIAKPLIVASHHHRFIVQEELKASGKQALAVILEPFGRNTAPAITVAALKLEKSGHADDQMLILPSDHIIKDPMAFNDAVKAASKAADKGFLCTFGIKPEKPETGFGYIASGDGIPDIQGAYTVTAFKEKPNTETATQYLADGGYYWNSGMFLMKVSTLLTELNTHQKKLLTACKNAFETAETDLDFIRLPEEEFSQVPADSIDYALMEKTSLAAIIPCDLGWSDLGSYTALSDNTEKDLQGNAVIGDSVLINCKNNYIRSESKLVTAIGLKDTIIIATDDAILVAPKDHDQDIKKIVTELQAGHREEADHHSTVYRPWGTYKSIAAGTRYQVKEITVYPGKRLSLQLHHHRAEHWVIVAGSGIITRGEEEILLREDQSIYLPIGTKHRLENPGKVPLTLIEIQTGSYLGEDDIVRFDDDFGRGQTID